MVHQTMMFPGSRILNHPCEALKACSQQRAVDLDVEAMMVASLSRSTPVAKHSEWDHIGPEFLTILTGGLRLKPPGCGKAFLPKPLWSSIGSQNVPIRPTDPLLVALSTRQFIKSVQVDIIKSRLRLSKRGSDAMKHSETNQLHSSATFDA